MTKPTWKELVAAEPQLAALLKEARAVKDNGGPSFCANAVWYGHFRYTGHGLRERLYSLVGWEASKSLPEFARTSEAFDVAYKKIYNALPDCRNCLCF